MIIKQSNDVNSATKFTLYKTGCNIEICYSDKELKHRSKLLADLQWQKGHMTFIMAVVSLSVMERSICVCFISHLAFQENVIFVIQYNQLIIIVSENKEMKFRKFLLGYNISLQLFDVEYSVFFTLS